MKSSARKTRSVPLFQRLSFGEDGEEGTGEGHPDRGKVVTGSRARKCNRRTREGGICSRHFKLRQAITGRHYRTFFGRSGCRILQVEYAWRAVLLARSGRVVMRVMSCEMHSAGSVLNEIGESVAALFSFLSQISYMWSLDPWAQCVNSCEAARRHQVSCRMSCSMHKSQQFES